MPINTSYVTSHAARRMAQRNVSLAEADLVVRYGTVEYRTGAEFYFLGRRDIPPGRDRELGGLVGTTVVVYRGRICTVYKNRCALPTIRRKSKRRTPGKIADRQRLRQRGVRFIRRHLCDKDSSIQNKEQKTCFSQAS